MAITRAWALVLTLNFSRTCVICLRTVVGDNPLVRNRVATSIRSGKNLKIGRGKTASYSLKIKQRSDSRRVIIKTRLVKLAGSGMRQAKLHMEYLQRDGVTREGDAGLMYDATGDNIEAEKFNDLCKADRLRPSQPQKLQSKR